MNSESGKYKYKYEVHMHTSQASACGRTDGKEYIAKFKSLGYDGMIITFTEVTQDLPEAFPGLNTLTSFAADMKLPKKKETSRDSRFSLAGRKTSTVMNI